MTEGKVKWFSKEKGYGYITCTESADQTDYFFHITSVRGTESPCEGDTVEFEAKSTKKGLQAQDVIIAEKALAGQASKERFPGRSDDRVGCKHCRKRMVPRLKFYHGEPVARLCPYCMKSQEEEEETTIWPLIIVLVIGSVALAYCSG